MTAPTVHDPCAVMRDALDRMRRARPMVRPWPGLVPTPKRWCRECRIHLANEGGVGDLKDLCVVCEAEAGRAS